jgi:hypothetical protein
MEEGQTKRSTATGISETSGSGDKYAPFTHLNDCPVPPRCFNRGIRHIIDVWDSPSRNFRHDPAPPYHLHNISVLPRRAAGELTATSIE